MAQKSKQTKVSESSFGISMADWSQTFSTFGGLNPTARADVRRERPKELAEPDSESDLYKALYKASSLAAAYSASSTDHSRRLKAAHAAVNEAADMVERGQQLPSDVAAWIADMLRKWGAQLPSKPHKKRGRPRTKSPPSILAEMKALHSERAARGQVRLSKTAALEVIAEKFDMTKENARTVLRREIEAVERRITSEIEARSKRAAK